MSPSFAQKKINIERGLKDLKEIQQKKIVRRPLTPKGSQEIINEF